MRYAVVGLLTVLGCCGLVAADIPGPASPDGTRLVFFAARAVESQPETDKPPYGLFVVGLDGGGLACLETDLRAGPHRPLAAAWSPDGATLAYLRGGELVVLDWATGARSSWAAAERDWMIASLCWPADGRLVVVTEWIHQRHRLLLLDPARLDQGPVELASRRGAMHRWMGLAPDGEGGIYYVYENPQLGRSRNQSVLRLNPLAPGGEPQVVSEGLSHAERLQRLPDGRLLGEGQRRWELIDPAAGTFAEWEPSKLLPRGHALLASAGPRGVQHVTMLPDGERMVFSQFQRDEEGREGEVLYVCGLDGSGLQRLTTLDPTPVPMWSPAKGG